MSSTEHLSVLNIIRMVRGCFVVTANDLNGSEWLGIIPGQQKASWSDWWDVESFLYESFNIRL